MWMVAVDSFRNQAYSGPNLRWSVDKVLGSIWGIPGRANEQRSTEGVETCGVVAQEKFREPK